MAGFHDRLSDPLLPTQKAGPQGLRERAYRLLPKALRAKLEEVPTRPQGRWCPEEDANVLERVFFTYVGPIVRMGVKVGLEAEDVWDLHRKDETARVAANFQKHLEASRSAKHPSGNLWIAIWTAHRRLWVISGFWILMFSVTLFVNPLILEQLLFNLQSGGSPAKGLGFAVALYAANLGTSISGNAYFQYVYRITMHLKAGLIDTIYRKSLSVTNASKGGMGIGAIINLQSNDAYRLWMMIVFLQALWYGPMQIIVVLLLLFRILGVYASLAGVAVTFMLVPLSAIIGRFMSSIRRKLLRDTDERVKLTTEVLTGIKAIKLYAWEEPYYQRINALREAELRHIRNAALCTTFNYILFLGGPILVAMAAFGTYAGMGFTLTAEVAFPAIAYFNVLRIPLLSLPDQIMNIINGRIAVNRIEKFLEEPDRPVPPELPPAKAGEAAVEVRGGTFAWSPQTEPVLRDIELAVPAGKLVMVVGEVGSGKTSLLSVLLREMHTVSGEVVVRGSLAYTAQDPWIQNATLRDNVLMGHAFDEKKYQRTINACAMRPDLDMLPAGDETEIGEKGVNLSGGQRHRVALARAVYAGADVYLMDDPLSAVDAHVGRHLFDNVMRGELAGSTRLLVTHQVQFVPGADLVIVIANNKIGEFGTYDELVAKGVDFARFHMEETPEEEGILTDPPAPMPPLPLSSADQASSSSSQPSEPSESESDSGSPRESGKFGKAAALRRVSRDDPATRKGGMTAERSVVSFNVEQDKKKVDDGKQISKEHRARGRIPWSLYGAYLAAWSPFFLMPAALFFFTGLDRGGQQVQSLWLSIWTNGVSGAQADGTQPNDLYYLFIYLAIGFGSLGFQMIRQVLLVFGTTNASRHLHKNLLQKVLRLPMSFFDSQPSGRLLNRFSRDTQAVDVELILYFNNLLTTFANLVASLVVIAGVAPFVLLALVPISFAYRIVQDMYLTTSRELKRLDSLAFSPIFANFSETLVGLTSLRAFRREDHLYANNRHLLDDSNRMYWPMQQVARWLGLRIDILGSSVVFLTAIFVAAVLRRSPGLAGLALTSALQMTQQLNFMVRNISDLEVSMNGVERMVEYTELTPEKPAIVEKNRPPASWPSQGAISVEGLWVRYRADRDPVLKGLTFSVNGREKIGVAGRTGCGKSTLMMALYRLVEPSGGRIVIDGINVLEIGTYDLRSKLALVPQDPVIFSGSVRENLDPFGSSGGDAAIWEALKQAGMADTITAMEGRQGLDSVISEGGGNLSTGQRQLLCMARALLRRSRILILDEATSNVDNTTDSLIQTTIRSAFRECTTLTIAHRLHTIIDSTRVLVLEAGEVLEFDSPENLLKDPKSAFFSLVQSTQASQH